MSNTRSRECSSALLYNLDITTKERLHQLVDALDDEEAVSVLHLLSEHMPRQRARRKLPSWVGSGRSKHGETDVASRAKEILQAELGSGPAAHPC